MSSNIVDSVSKILTKRQAVTIKGDNTSVYASVMMVIKKSSNCYSTLLIRRSINDKDVFSGHMAFPGGKTIYDDKNKLETAFRETHEEVGINLRNNSMVLGHLDDCNPSTPAARRFIVRPYVSFLNEEQSIILNNEVSEALWIPIVELKNIYLSNLQRYKGEIRKEAFEYHYNKYFIWGLTGRILNNFFDLTGDIFD